MQMLFLIHFRLLNKLAAEVFQMKINIDKSLVTYALVFGQIELQSLNGFFFPGTCN